MRRILYGLVIVALLFGVGLVTGVSAGVTLQLWSPWGEGPYWEAFNLLAKRYHELDKDVTIKVVSVPDVNSKLQVSIAGGIPPDITVANGGIIPFKSSLPNLLVPLTPLMKRDKVLDDYLPASLISFATWEDVAYAAPYSLDPNFAVPYNVELFEQSGLDSRKPPNTPEELLQYSDKIFKRDASGKVTQVGMVPWRMYGEHTALLNWCLAFGGEQYTDGKHYKLTVPAVEKALDFMTAYGNRYGGPAQIDALGNQYRYYDLTHIAMQPLTSPDALRISELFPDMEVSLTYLPAARGGVAPVWLGGQWLAIPVGSKHVEESWKFIKWATLDLEAIKMTRAVRFAGAKAAYDGSVYSPKAIQADLNAKGGTAAMMARILGYYSTLAPKAQPILEAAVWYWSDIASTVRSVVVDRKGDPIMTMKELNRVLNERVDKSVKGAK